MEHVSHYGRLERDTETGVGRGSEPEEDPSGDGNALVDAEEDPGARRTAGLPAATAPDQEEAGGSQ